MSPRTHIARRGRRWLLGLAVGAALVATGSALADTATVGPVVVPTQPTNFSTTIDLAKFNPADHPGMSLTQVKCTVAANVAGKIEVENLGPDASTITSQLSANVRLGGASSPIDVTAAAASGQFVDPVTAHDMTSNYTGGDAKTHDPVAGTGTNSVTITDLPTLLSFIGTGNITLPVSATGTSFASGPGNVQSRFTTNAGASISCEYTFSSGVLAATLRSVTATPSAKGVTVNWRTASEVDVAGYNVYGLVHGKRVKLNAHIIASKGAGANSYAFNYRTPKGQRAPTQLWLQAINLDGTRTMRAARIVH